MDYALITLRTKDNSWEKDLELPAKMKLKNVARKVLDTIKAMDESRFADIYRLRFTYETKVLNEEATLADYQIWDGSILYISY